ncbi:MAG: NAD-dependent epimerase/dehydratase family protein [Caldilineaceae bacterium]|nr:NAD-dependent epimerase/dehydratase family protein [Caldilineaceae bacterium]
MAKYLVTGAAGFIGSKVIEMLLAEGHVVVGVDNMNQAYDLRLKQWRLATLISRPNFIYYCLDITDQQRLRDLFESHVDSASESFAAVINLAARAGVRPSVINPWTYFDTNTTGTLNLLELCKDFAVPKFILSSTSSLYGKDNPMPWREMQCTNLPLSPYAASKKAAEVLCYTYHYLYGLDVTVFRYFTVYGPAGRPDMSLFRFIQWISEGRPVVVFGDGKQSRDFTYVDDIARGTIAGLAPVGYEIINLGSDEPVVLLDAIHLIEEIVGRKAVLEFETRHAADTPASWADNNKARNLLHWQPRSVFAHGVEESVNWYMAHRAWAQEIVTYD